MRDLLVLFKDKEVYVDVTVFKTPAIRRVPNPMTSNVATR